MSTEITTKPPTQPAGAAEIAPAKAATYLKLPLTDKGELIKAGTFLKSPRNQIIISPPKSGKTDNMLGVKNFLIGDCEDGAVYFEDSNYVDLLKHSSEYPVYQSKLGNYIPSGLYETVLELSRANNMKAFNTLYDELKKTKSEKSYNKVIELINKMPFPIFTIDTLTSLMKLVYQTALIEYNSKVDTDKQKFDIKRVDNYGGVQYIRRAVDDIKYFIERNAAPFINYNGHIKMKKSVLKKTDEEISVVDLALEGVLPLLFTSQAAAVATFYRDETGCYLDYCKKSEDDKDARCRHLSNKVIKIADLHEFEDRDGTQVLKKKGKTYWNKIYPELSF